MEIKSNVTEAISLLLILRMSDRSELEVGPFTVLPLATKRIQLKEYFPAIYQRGHHGDWGNGTREGSLFGSAQLVSVRPFDSAATDYAAWVVVKNRREGLGFPVTFQVPRSDFIALDSIWWRPYPNTRNYFAFQNTSDAAMHCRLEISGVGGERATQSLSLAPYQPTLISVDDFVKEGGIDVGGIRITPETRYLQPTPLVGRGFAVQQERGFSTPLLGHQFVGALPSDSRFELQGLAFFGPLSRLLPRSEATMRPHLLLRNTGERAREVVIRIQSGHGDTARRTESRVNLHSDASLHLDLTGAFAGVAPEGPASVIISHQGHATDLIAELINVDESGDVVWFDRVKNLFFHQATVQSVISFDLSPETRTFLVLMNLSDRQQAATVVVDHHEGQGHFRLGTGPMPGRSTTVIDLASLRNQAVPGEDGQPIPSDADYGGAGIFSESGSVGGSDPTFFVRPPPTIVEPGWGDEGGVTYSCLVDTSPPGGPPGPSGGPWPQSPPPHTYPQGPFAGPCAQGRGCTHNGSQPHSGWDTWPDGSNFAPFDVQAMEPGTVTGLNAAGQQGSGPANAVIIRGLDNYITIYAHVTPAANLAVGSVVQRGQVIGRADLSGVTNDMYHVHISRLAPGDGSFQGTQDRISRGDYDCNFTLPCRQVGSP